MTEIAKRVGPAKVNLGGWDVGSVDNQEFKKAIRKLVRSMASECIEGSLYNFPPMVEFSPPGDDKDEDPTTMHIILTLGGDICFSVSLSKIIEEYIGDHLWIQKGKTIEGLRIQGKDAEKSRLIAARLRELATQLEEKCA
jgi:hypothetical protein